MADLDAPCIIDGIEYPSPACYSDEQMNRVVEPIIEAMAARTRLRAQVEQLQRELSEKPGDMGLAAEVEAMQVRLDESTSRIRELTSNNASLETDLQRSNADLIGANNSAKAATRLLAKAETKLEESEAERMLVVQQLNDTLIGIDELKQALLACDNEIARLSNELSNSTLNAKDASADKSFLQEKLDIEMQRRADAESRLVERELVVVDLQNRLLKNCMKITALL